MTKDRHDERYKQHNLEDWGSVLLKEMRLTLDDAIDDSLITVNIREILQVV